MQTGVSTRMKILGAAALVLVIGVVIGGLGGSESRPTQATPTEARQAALPVAPIAIDAARLWRSYEANEVAADVLYKGKLLRVTGVVSGIDKDMLGGILISLRAPNQFMPSRASLRDSQQRRAADLTKGQRVVMICEGAGRILGSPMLSDCEFAE